RRKLSPMQSVHSVTYLSGSDRRHLSPRHYAGRNARQGNEGQRKPEALSLLSILLALESVASPVIY
ncbi:hypothetical protein, partial [Mesorhizobium muleiense]|uniref:hypothetical protein n=1 Tax=Mesorhizobium muleiense TaxID=1004279 RepID=UPI001F1E346C